MTVIRKKASRIDFPIVGIGASAGGLDAFLVFLKALPSDTGMAFVLLQHLDPSHPSLLCDALSSSSSMPIQETSHGLSVKKNHVYVMPSNVELEIEQNRFRQQAREKITGELNLPINHFFASLARNSERKAIGIVLSGLGSDGTEGLRTIKEYGGFTLAQKPKTARYASMPESAILANVVDYQLPIAGIAKEIVRLASYLSENNQTDNEETSRNGLVEIQEILNIVKQNTGITFQEYKMATIQRRINRRLAILNIDQLAKYSKFLRTNGNEVKRLSAELLIHVSSFYRNPDSYERLKTSVFPEIIKTKNSNKPIRIWIAGCSSGEEVYSITISLLEFLHEKNISFPIQVFATDISEEMILKARNGFYLENSVNGLSSSQISKYFVKTENGYKISKLVRDLCLFVRHDLAKDPPFSKIDLICCRNVLIYFEQKLQKKILASFHYCLNDSAFLFLGKTENITSNRGLFSIVDSENKIFSRVNIPSKLNFQLQQGIIPKRMEKSLHFDAPVSNTFYEVSRSVDSLLLTDYAPCGVVINSLFEVLEFRGQTNIYIQQAAGIPEANLLRMLREPLLSEVKDALAKVMRHASVYRKNGIRLVNGAVVSECNIVVREISVFSATNEKLFLILFEQMKIAQPSETLISKKTRPADRSELLSSELTNIKAYLHTLTQNNQKINDALATANEELVSGNEELQSLNEEMETAKEELQSTNEELTTVNDELNNRNHELGVVNSDLVNLLNCIEIPIIMLDLKHKIRRFTPHARSIMKLIPSDIGRSIDDIKLNVNFLNMNKQIEEVLKNDLLHESEVQDRKGHWYRIQIRPYRDSGNAIDGAIISLTDINILKQALSKAEWAFDYAYRIVESVQIPLLVLNGSLQVLSANLAYYDTFKVEKKDVENKTLKELGMSEWTIRSHPLSLGKMLEKKTNFKNAEVEREFPKLGKRIMSLSAISVRSDPDIQPMILLGIEDITHRKSIELERKNLLQLTDEARVEAEKANRTKDIFLATLSHELRTPLTSLLLQTQILRRGRMDEAKTLHSIGVIESAAKVQAQLIEDLLDISRIISGKLIMHKQNINFTELVLGVITTIGTYADTRKVTIKTDLPDSPIFIFGDETRMKQVVWNLCNNAIKFSDKNTLVKVQLRSKNEFVFLKVLDHGVGIESSFIPKIFDRFVQSGDSLTRSHGGMGLGLAIVKYILDMHGAEIAVKSPGKNLGCAFTVKMPVIHANVPELVDEKQNPKPQAFLALMGRRILVVDDDEATMEALRELLQQAGASVMIACSAAEGMRDVRDFKPSMIICDIAMPEEDGYSFMRKLRKMNTKSGGKIPAIALTAMAGESDRIKAVEAGFQAHLAKPVHFQRLLETMIGLFK